jgi:hypothetical protein
MTNKRVPLYERLPEIYRIKDEEVSPPYQLKNYLELVEDAYGEIHKNITALYNDFFIATADDWVIPYIGDLLGTSHLTGDPWTLRADVADTIHLRRRKGTLASIEKLTYNLTQWGVHCTELRQNLVWNHNLNHQRPDIGGAPPHVSPGVNRHTAIRGGTIPVRDPALLSTLNTPFDPFAHLADLRPLTFGAIRYNLPNLAIFLWRLEAYRVPVSKPTFVKKSVVNGVHLVCFNVHPLGEPVRLFNTYQYDPDATPPVITSLDGTPNPIPTARLNEASPSGTGNPEQYLSVNTYDAANPNPDKIEITEVGLQLHLPENNFSGEAWPDPTGTTWQIRGENLCAWEAGVVPEIANREIIIDPAIGRILLGVNTAAEATALEKHLLVTYTYGAVGPVGAHPTSRTPSLQTIGGQAVEDRAVDFHADHQDLEKKLAGLDQSLKPVVVEIQDSMVHDLDLTSANISGTFTENGRENLNLNKPLVIRAAAGQRPVIRLKQPLRFRPKNVAEARKIVVRLEGLYLTRHASFPANQPLIARAAVNRLEIVNCTLDPGGYIQLDQTRAPIHTALELKEPYGFADPDEEKDFDQTPEIAITDSIAGPLRIDDGYTLALENSILDAGKGVGDDPADAFALTNATRPQTGWGPPTTVNQLTVFGRMRVIQIRGRGGIWVHALEVYNNQIGCLRYSYFSGINDRLPQNLGCVLGVGDHARLHFTAEAFGEPAYGQLAHNTDFRIRERGPGDDAMGAFGFLLEAHKWRNIQIRFREFMPVGITPLLLPVT